ncbi:methyl-accepting chemotaxis protein, partial [Campylobacter lari]|nr:methyl-accepting chemotaxis protein [Campylobacter lari]
MFKSLNIGFKLIISVSIVLILGLAMLIFIISNRVNNNITKNTEEILYITSEKYSNNIEGIFQEMISLSQSMASTLIDAFKADVKEDWDIDNITGIITNTLDNSAYANYTYMYLIDPPSYFKEESKLFLTQGGKFVMLYNDEDIYNKGGIRAIQSTDNIVDFSTIKEALTTARYGDNKVYISDPEKISLGDETFIGANITIPLFDKNKQIVGVIGMVFNFDSMSKKFLDPKSVKYEGELKYLVTSSGIIGIYNDRNVLLKNLMSINPNAQSKNAYNAIKESKNGVFDFIDMYSNDSYISVNSFDIHGKKWSILISAPKDSIFKPLKNLQLIIAFASIVFVFLFIIILYYCVQIIITSKLPIIQ